MDNLDILFGNGPFRKVRVDGRQLPKRCVELYDLARKEKLTHPLGRALYAINRLSNGAWPYIGPFVRMDPLNHMKRTQEKTAIKWREHWRKGGRIKSLKLRRESDSV
jgi:hypothetical protein